MLRAAYDKMLKYSGHPRAVQILGFISFIESSFFPFPPDPLYIAMLIENRKKAWYYAAVCTITSVLGGLLGYYIGYALYETIGRWIIESYGLQDKFQELQDSFNTWGFWIIALKGLTPIPYKLVTITCGVIHFDIWIFVLASLIARASRFYMLAGLLYKYGEPIKTFIDKNLTMVTIVGFTALAGGFYVIKYIF